MRQSGGEPSAEDIAAFREKLGMNDALPVRYLKWLRRTVQLDFGQSLATGEQVLSQIATRLPETLKLAAAAFLFMLAVSVPFGLITGLKQNGWVDHLGRLWSVFGISIPNYWLGLLLLYLFALKLQWLPIVNQGRLRDLVLPAVTLGLYAAAANSRLVRERVMEVMSQDYIKLACAKGLSQWEIVWRHTVKNAFAPMVTMWGINFGYLLGGSVVVESVFGWPGVGTLAIDAIANRDFPVLQAYILLVTTLFVAINLCVDLVVLLLDPRIMANMRKKHG